MNTIEAASLARDLMDEFGLSTWMFQWDNSKTRFGCCKYNRNVISLSEPLTLLNGEGQVSDTIRHEIAHALAGPSAGHGRAWQRQCLITGARPQRCYSGNVVQPPARWKLECPKCGITGTRHRKPTRVSYHGPCKVALVWTLQKEAS